MANKIIAVDFDGTLVKDKYPAIGIVIESTFNYVKSEQSKGSQVILWTCRKGDKLKEAVEFCAKHGLKFDYVNENTLEHIEKYDGDQSRKVYADEYIDDRNKFLPLPSNDLEALEHDLKIRDEARKDAIEQFCIALREFYEKEPIDDIEQLGKMFLDGRL